MRLRSLAGTALACTFAAILASAAVAVAEDASPLAAARSLFQAKCATCHALDRALAKQVDRDGWKAVMQKMIANGAKLEAQEADQITGYLTAKSLFETKCNGCHEIARPLAAIKNPDEWKATVKSMAAKKEGLLTDEEAGAIVLYLSLARPAK